MFSTRSDSLALITETSLSQPQQNLKPVEVLVMAAGLGTRMKSNRAKVLHQLGGLPLITHVIRTALSLDPKSIVVVVGHQASEVEEVVREEIGELAAVALQANQRGTGDAVESA